MATAPGNSTKSKSPKAPGTPPKRGWGRMLGCALAVGFIGVVVCVFAVVGIVVFLATRGGTKTTEKTQDTVVTTPVVNVSPTPPAATTALTSSTPAAPASLENLQKQVDELKGEILALNKRLDKGEKTTKKAEEDLREEDARRQEEHRKVMDDLTKSFDDLSRLLAQKKAERIREETRKKPGEDAVAMVERGVASRRDVDFELEDYSESRPPRSSSGVNPRVRAQIEEIDSQLAFLQRQMEILRAHKKYLLTNSRRR